MSKIHKTLAAILAIVMCLSLSAPVFAAETNATNDPTLAVTLPTVGANDYGIMPMDTTSRVIGPNWHTVATSDTPIETVYYEVTDDGYSGWVYQINIRCLSANGNTLKEFHNASGIFASNTLKFFQDHQLYNVYQIQMQIKPRIAASGDNYFRMSVTW